MVDQLKDPHALAVRTHQRDSLHRPGLVAGSSIEVPVDPVRGALGEMIGIGYVLDLAATGSEARQ